MENGQVNSTQAMVLRERRKSVLLRLWIATGIFFMALPGTLLGFSNLMAIVSHRRLGGLPAAWIQGHGHAQVFGWVGSFILGIGFYSQPAHGRSVVRLPLACYLLWTGGVASRWVASIYGWHWRAVYPLSAGAEMAAVLLFLLAASRHKRPDERSALGADAATSRSRRSPMPLWMAAVLLGSAGLFTMVTFNFVECLHLALVGASRAFPHGLDQRYLVLMAWGFLTPMVWGFSARWLPAFLAIPQPDSDLLSFALWMDVLGVLCGVFGWTLLATMLLAVSAVAIGFALHLAERPHGQAKVAGIHPSFPSFVRVAFLWLAVAGFLGVWAAVADQHGGIWGASRHALTVGFVATMIFAIGPRILPHFSGFYSIYSKRLMFLSLLMLQTGCLLRASSEALAYEGILPVAWKVLPASAMLELSGVHLFALNLMLTFALGRSSFASAPGEHALAVC
jgi:hypothetical protein